MAWKTSARIKSPKGTRRDLWVGFKPNGIGETKPNHYKEVLKTIWDNRDNLPYAWRILNRGVCDGSITLAEAQRRESALKHRDG